MYHFYKKPYFIVVILFVVIAIFLFLFFSNNSDQKVAKKFINLYYNVNDTKIYHSNDINEIEVALSKKYKNLITDNALKTLAANRSILEGEHAADNSKCTLNVKKITIKLIENNSNSKLYGFTIDAQVIFSDSNKKYISQTGTIKLIREGKQWKVDMFYTKVGELYKLMSK